MIKMVNFNIVENYSHENKYQGFERDFVNGMSKADLVKKYDISHRVWVEWRDRILDSNNTIKRNILPKYCKPKIYKKVNFSDNFFKTNYKGNVSVYRRLEGNKIASYGTYPTMDIAVKIRDKLLECGWDKNIAYDLLQKYGVANSKRILSSRMLRRTI